MLLILLTHQILLWLGPQGADPIIEKGLDDEGSDLIIIIY
jgi:hypothetical protein